MTVTPVSDTAVLQEASGQVAAGTIEIQGLSAGTFNPDYWQKNTLNWVPDVRMPLLAAQPTGTYHNVYAPWSLEQADGWRFFYGSWDGTDTPFDQIYSVFTTDFVSFANRHHIIANGNFLSVACSDARGLPCYAPTGLLHRVTHESRDDAGAIVQCHSGSIDHRAVSSHHKRVLVKALRPVSPERLHRHGWKALIRLSPMPLKKP
ncbi:MAG: hypothetical protein M3O82_06235 [Verrucomicrobiota bacterium]|nr:hypothetical protein [Verrucomicrobiota bacterium]